MSNENTYRVEAWVKAEKSIEIEAESEEAAIEEAERLVDEELVYGSLDARGELERPRAAEL